MVCRSVSRGGGEEMHHIPHTWVNSYSEAGLAGWWGVSQPKNWANSCRAVGLGVHPLNLGQFSKIHAFFFFHSILDCINLASKY